MMIVELVYMLYMEHMQTPCGRNDDDRELWLEGIPAY